MGGCNSSSTPRFVLLFTKRWYFVLHVARCVIISPFCLFSPSQSFWHRYPTFLPQLSLFLSLNAHTVAHHTILFPFNTPPPLLSALPLCPLPSFLLSLSQCDGLSGWFLRCRWSLCKYDSVSSTVSLSPSFPPSVCGFSSVRQHGPNQWSRVLMDAATCSRFYK